jgi:hypothetical protein
MRSWALLLGACSAAAAALCGQNEIAMMNMCEHPGTVKYIESFIFDRCL